MFIRFIRLFPAGSTAWLIGWQLILQWRSLNRYPKLIWYVFPPLLIFLQSCAYIISLNLPSYTKEIIWTTLIAVMLVIFGACCSRAIQAVLRLILHRELFTTFFLAPISPEKFGLVSLLHIVLYSLIFIGFFYSPFALELMSIGHPAGFAFFLWFPALVILGSLIGLSLIIGTLHLFGIRKARYTFQFIGGILSITLISSVILPYFNTKLMKSSFQFLEQHIESSIWWHQAGFFQSLRDIALGFKPQAYFFLFTSALLFRLTASFFSKQLFSLQYKTQNKINTLSHYSLDHFSLHYFIYLFKKEWKIIIRDQRFHSEVALDAAQIFPLLLLGIYNLKHIVFSFLIGIAWISLSSLISARLCWLSISIESAMPWYFISPQKQPLLRKGKWLCIIAPFLFITLIISLLFLLFYSLKTTLLFSSISILSILCSSLIHIWLAVPLSSTQGFYQRLNRFPLAEILGLFFIYGTTFFYVFTSIWGIQRTGLALLPLATILFTAYRFRLPLSPSSRVR
jgi:hypothetical protein